MMLDIDSLRLRLTNAVRENFALGDLLGVGGSASVFRARDLVLNRDVAIKVIDPALAESAPIEDRRTPTGTGRIPFATGDLDIRRNLSLFGSSTGVVTSPQAAGRVDCCAT